MYRKITIDTLDAKKIELKMYPEENHKIITIRHEIEMTFAMRKALTSFLSAMDILMDKNEICRVEIEEIE